MTTAGTSRNEVNEMRRTRKLAAVVVLAAVVGVGGAAVVHAGAEREPDPPLGVVRDAAGNPRRTTDGQYVIDPALLPKELPVLDHRGRVIGSVESSAVFTPPPGPGTTDSVPQEPNTVEKDGLPKGG
jgi:hypothetical protein